MIHQRIKYKFHQQEISFILDLSSKGTKNLDDAQESNQDQQSVDAVSKLVSACTFDKSDVINAPTFDVGISFFTNKK